MPVNEIIQKRKSVRNYKEGAIVTEEQIKIILEAGMLAPSACNSRPWEFIVVRNREKLEEIMKVHPFTKMLKTAGIAILVCANMDLNYKDFFPQDCAATTQNILLQSTDLGLGTCWCGIYPIERLIVNFKKIFDLPENIMPFNIIAVGVSVEEFGARGYYEDSKVKWID